MMDRADAAATIPLVEEKAVVSVREALTGRVRVSTRTETFAEVVRQDLLGMRADVVRVPINRTLGAGEAPPQPRTEGAVMIIPILEEVIIARDQIRMVAGNADTSLEIDTTPSEPREKGFFGALADLFMPANDRYAYAEGLSRGGFLVSLNTTPENRDRILDILDDEGTVDMDAREESWRAEGWPGYQAAGATMPVGTTGSAAATGSAPAFDAPDDGTIEVVEENLRVGKRAVDQGRVRVRSYVVETPVEEEVSLRGETVHLERRPVDRAVGAGEAFVDRTIEATETSEEAVVSKEARVTEELSLEKAVDTRTETVRDTVRHTEVEVDDERTERTR